MISPVKTFNKYLAGPIYGTPDSRWYIHSGGDNGSIIKLGKLITVLITFSDKEGVCGWEYFNETLKTHGTITDAELGKRCDKMPLAPPTYLH